MRWKYLTLVAVAGLATVACGTATPTPTATTTPTATPTPPPTNQAQPASACQANPDPATPAQVVITQPIAHAQVTTPLTVDGSINAFEATFQVSIKDASGTDIVTQTGHSQQGQTLSSIITAHVAFTVSGPTPACLWVFQFSANTGSPSMIQQVPITLMP